MMYFFELLKTHTFSDEETLNPSCHVFESYYSHLAVLLRQARNSIMKTAFAFEKAVPLTNDDLSFHSYCFFLPSPPSTLSLGSPEQLLQSWGMQAEGNTQRGKTRPLNNSFAFSSPRHPNIYSLIPSIISWFKQRTIITLHCHSSNSSE